MAPLPKQSVTGRGQPMQAPNLRIADDSWPKPDWPTPRAHYSIRLESVQKSIPPSAIFCAQQKLIRTMEIPPAVSIGRSVNWQLGGVNRVPLFNNRRSSPRSGVEM